MDEENEEEQKISMFFPEENTEKQKKMKFSEEILKDIIQSEISKKKEIFEYLEDENISITYKMRGIVIDWMMEFSYDLNYEKEAFYQSVCYFDRYLNKKINKNFHKEKLQLVAAGCLLLSAKKNVFKIKFK